MAPADQTQHTTVSWTAPERIEERELRQSVELFAVASLLARTPSS